MIRHLALALGLMAGSLSPAPGPGGYVDCTSIADDLVTFHVDTLTPEYPVWYDGGVTVTQRATHRGIVITTDRPVAGIIVIGSRVMRTIDRPGSRYLARLPHDTVREVQVCYR